MVIPLITFKCNVEVRNKKHVKIWILKKSTKTTSSHYYYSLQFLRCFIPLSYYVVKGMMQLKNLLCMFMRIIHLVLYYLCIVRYALSLYFYHLFISNQRELTKTNILITTIMDCTPE